MQTSDFTEHKSGQLLRGPGGYWAFVPEPLPPRLDWDGDLAGALSGATLALGELSGAGRLMPNPHLLIGPFLRQEAVLSSKIEGTVCSLSDLFEFEAEPSIVTDVPDVREVSNYVRALDHGLSRLDELSLSLRLIKELHEILMDGVRGEHLTPGEFRRTQNWIGPPRCTLDNATYVPPPPADGQYRSLSATCNLMIAPRLGPAIDPSVVRSPARSSSGSIAVGRSLSASARTTSSLTAVAIARSAPSPRPSPAPIGTAGCSSDLRG